MTCIDQAIAKLRELHEVAHQEVWRDEEGVPTDEEQMKRASDVALAGMRLGILGGSHMLRAMEALSLTGSVIYRRLGPDVPGPRVALVAAFAVCNDLADALLGPEGKPSD